MNNIILTKEEFLNTLSIYYSIKERRDLIVKDNLKIKYIKGMEEIDIKLYIDMYIKGDKITIFLNKKDIMEALVAYINNLGYELIDFKYMGGVRHTGYYVEENTPIFEGVNIQVKEKDKKLVRK